MKKIQSFSIQKATTSELVKYLSHYSDENREPVCAYVKL